MAYTLCGAFTAADVVARAWRIQWLLRGLGARVSFRDAAIVNVIGDGAAAVTPLRVGGQPARLGAFVRAGVPAPRALAAIGIEAALMYPVVIALGVALGVLFAPDWWHEVGPGLVASARRAVSWAAGILLLLAGLVVWLRRRRRAPTAKRSVLADLRAMPRWPLLASIPLSVVNVVARVAILPILAATLDRAPALGASLMGSYVLLYGQLVMPTPSGAGVVEYGFLSGVAGDMHAEARHVLVAWRFFTVGLFIVAALVLAAARFGIAPLRSLVGRDRRAAAPPTEGVQP